MVDPFASPASLSSNCPTLPKPCAQRPTNSPRSLREAVADTHTHTGHGRIRQYPAHDQYKPGSMSSAGDSALMTPMSSVDLEKASLAKEREPERPSRDSKRSKGSKGSKGSKNSRTNRDPEKAMDTSHHLNSTNTTTYTEDGDDIDDGTQLQDEKAVKILAFFAGPCVLLSAVNLAWAFIALVITALTQPIRLCARRPSFGQQLSGLLGPTLNLQLRCIYTPLPPHANEDASYHATQLLLVHVVSPFLSFVMMFAAWVLAVYWISSAVVGDPAGQDKRDDGKETVLGLRKWWESWLMRSIRDD